VGRAGRLAAVDGGGRRQPTLRACVLREEEATAVEAATSAATVRPAIGRPRRRSTRSGRRRPLARTNALPPTADAAAYDGGAVPNDNDSDRAQRHVRRAATPPAQR
jgi:hypothetical protein